MCHLRKKKDAVRLVRAWSGSLKEKERNGHMAGWIVLKNGKKTLQSDIFMTCMCLPGLMCLPGPSCRGVLAGLPHTTGRLASRQGTPQCRVQVECLSIPDGGEGGACRATGGGSGGHRRYTCGGSKTAEVEKRIDDQGRSRFGSPVVTRSAVRGAHRVGRIRSCPPWPSRRVLRDGSGRSASRRRGFAARASLVAGVCGVFFS